MAHQCAIMGDLAAAPADLVSAENDAQSPVKSIHHFPLTANRTRNLLRVRGKAAEVVVSFDHGPVTDRAVALNHGKTSEVTLLIGLLRAIDHLEGTPKADFPPALTARVGFLGTVDDQRLLDAGVDEQDRFEQIRMLVVDAQHAVAVRFTNFQRDRRPAAHGMNDGNYGPLYVERAQQLWNCGDLVSLFRRRRLSDDGNFGSKGAEPASGREFWRRIVFDRNAEAAQQ